MREVDGDAQIGIIDRGYGSEIATFQEQGVHSLLSGNLMDVCPVGAITTRDYRFKSRPWDNPLAVDTICTLLLEGLQHDRVAQGEARVGEGADASSASRRGSTPRSTATGCATSAASTTTGSRATTRLRHAARARRQRARSSRPTWHGALAKVRETLGCRSRRAAARRCGSWCRRTPRTRSCSSSASSSRSCRGGEAVERRMAVSLATSAKAQPAGDEVHGAAGGRAQRGRRARHRASRVRRRGTTAARDVCALRAAVEAGRGRGALRARPGPGRLHRRPPVGDRRARTPARCRCSSSRACC